MPPPFYVEAKVFEVEYEQFILFVFFLLRTFEIKLWKNRKAVNQRSSDSLSATTMKFPPTRSSLFLDIKYSN